MLRTILTALGLAYIFAFGLFLSFLIPFNAEGGSVPAGLIGLSAGLGHVLTGLFCGLVATRHKTHPSVVADIMMMSIFGYFTPFIFILDRIDTYRYKRKMMLATARIR